MSEASRFDRQRGLTTCVCQAKRKKRPRTEKYPCQAKELLPQMSSFSRKTADISPNKRRLTLTPRLNPARCHFSSFSLPSQECFSGKSFKEEGSPGGVSYKVVEKRLLETSLLETSRKRLF